MKKITIIFKPTFECNFRCQYCYHADTDYAKGKMDISLFEELLDKTFAYYNHVEIIFHGGEPLLMGYDFIERAIGMINEKCPENTWLRIGMQTNGFFLDEKYCKLFKKNNIQTSVSVDGIGDMNCLREKTDIVLEKLQRLKEKGYDFNLLGVVHSLNINGYEEYYNFCKQEGFHLKLNPIFKSGLASSNESYLLQSKEYINLLKDFYPKWASDLNPLRHFDPFYNLTLMAINNRGHECGQCGCLTKWICVDYDGSLYPCGRSYPSKYCLGNIKDIDRLDEAFNHPNFRTLLEESIIRRSDCAEKCELYPSCQGGCNNDCLLSGDVSKPNSFNCDVYKEMIPYIRDYIGNKDNQLKIKNPDIIEILRRNNRVKHNDK